MMDLPPAQAPQNIHQAGVGMATFGGDARMIVRFYDLPIRNAFKSEQAGEPVFDTVTMVSMRQPGERDELHRKATVYDAERFPRHWAAFQANQRQDVIGTPLEVMFDGKPEIVTMLAALKVTTVEQLAGSTEQAIQRMGLGARGWVVKAQALLEGIRAGAPTMALQAEVDQMKVERERMQQQMQEMSEQLAALTAAKTRAKRQREDVE